MGEEKRNGARRSEPKYRRSGRVSAPPLETLRERERETEEREREAAPFCFPLKWRSFLFFCILFFAGEALGFVSFVCFFSLKEEEKREREREDAIMPKIQQPRGGVKKQKLETRSPHHILQQDSNMTLTPFGPMPSHLAQSVFWGMAAQQEYLT